MRNGYLAGVSVEFCLAVHANVDILLYACSVNSGCRIADEGVRPPIVSALIFAFLLGLYRQLPGSHGYVLIQAVLSLILEELV